MASKRASHLVRCLRALARDTKNTLKLRLRACELLMAIDPTVERKTDGDDPNLRFSKQLAALVSYCSQNSEQKDAGRT